MRQSIVVTTPPTIEPITAAEAKAHLRVDVADDDALIDRLISAARRHCESWTRRAFIEQTLTLKCDYFPAEFRCPRPPLISVASDGLKYYNSAGMLATLAASQYTVDTGSYVGRVIPAYQVSWPSARGHTDDVQLTYKAGFGGAAASVPEDVRAAILLFLGHLYEHREAVVIGATPSQLPFAVESLLAPHRVFLEV